MDKEKELKSLGEQIRKERTKKGLTQFKLAEFCHLNKNYIGMLERGEVNPTYITLLNIARALTINLTIK